MMLSPAHLVAYPQVQCLLVNEHFYKSRYVDRIFLHTQRLYMRPLVIPHLCSIWMGVSRFWLMPTIEQWVGGKIDSTSSSTASSPRGTGGEMLSWPGEEMDQEKEWWALNLSIPWDKLWRVVRILRCTSVLSVGGAVVGLSTHLWLVGLKL